MSGRMEKNELSGKSGPHPLMSSVDVSELTSMENMSNVSIKELEKRFEGIDLQIKELEEKIKTLRHEKSKLSLKWTEDNPL